MIRAIMDWMTITTTTTTLMNCMIAHTRVAGLPHVIIILVVIVISPSSLALSLLSFVLLLQPHTTVAALPHGPPASRFWFFISGSWFSFLVQKMYDGIYKIDLKSHQASLASYASKDHLFLPSSRSYCYLKSHQAGFSCFIWPTCLVPRLLSAGLCIPRKVENLLSLILSFTNLVQVHQKRHNPVQEGSNSKLVKFYLFLLTYNPQSLRTK